MEVVSLYELNKYLKQVIALNFSESLWVKAEITQCRYSRGHYYLELVEKSKETDTVLAQSSAVIWAGDALRIEKTLSEPILKFLQSGAEVKLLVDPDFHERYGLKLVVRDIDQEFSIGQLEIKRREALDQLIREGLMNINKGAYLPPVLQKIAIISSPTAAGFKDFMDQLHNNAYGLKFHSTLFESAMQGEYVEKDILHQISVIEKSDFDCIVIIRGGGSRMDLSDFDSYAIGKAIALAPIPVLTGIGHEIDRSIADDVAHTSLKTPTAVAEYIIAKALEFISTLQDLVDNINLISSQHINEQLTTINRLRYQMTVAQFQFIKEASNKLSTYQVQLQQNVGAFFWKKESEIQQLKKQLSLLDYKSVLKRGYSITVQENIIIQNIQQIQSDKPLLTRLEGGQIISDIKEITHE
jgi:exodeoxyribonuclease VII large subunit